MKLIEIFFCARNKYWIIWILLYKRKRKTLDLAILHLGCKENSNTCKTVVNDRSRLKNNKAWISFISKSGYIIPHLMIIVSTIIPLSDTTGTVAEKTLWPSYRVPLRFCRSLTILSSAPLAQSVTGFTTVTTRPTAAPSSLESLREQWH